MDKSILQELEFYKNGSAESVLLRYKFSEEQERMKALYKGLITYFRE